MTEWLNSRLEASPLLSSPWRCLRVYARGMSEFARANSEGGRSGSVGFDPNRDVVHPSSRLSGPELVTRSAQEWEERCLQR